MGEIRSEYPAVLQAYHIQATPGRVAILRIINEKFVQGFTLYELFKEIEKEGLSVSTLSVIATVGLFRLRGLVKKTKSIQAASTSPASDSSKLICMLKFKDLKDNDGAANPVKE